LSTPPLKDFCLQIEDQASKWRYSWYNAWLFFKMFLVTLKTTVRMGMINQVIVILILLPPKWWRVNVLPRHS